jgi:HNH endonuclease
VSIYISVKIHKQIHQQFNNCCAYCQTAESLIATTFEIEHIIPRSLGGESNIDNLCLSCPHCNRHKATRQNFPDPETQQLTSLFHPQQQIWQEHFAWDTTASVLIAANPIGRATIAALEINRPALVRLRKLWHKLGEHPPQRF